MDILRDKRYKDYGRLSRYMSFPTYYNTLDNKYMYGTTLNLYDKTPYKIHISSENDSYDKMAVKYYDNPTYYWIICDFNRIHNPFLPPEPGSRIKIPSLSDIKFKA